MLATPWMANWQRFAMRRIFFLKIFIMSKCPNFLPSKFSNWDSYLTTVLQSLASFFSSNFQNVSNIQNVKVFKISKYSKCQNFQNVKIFKFVRSTVNGLQWPASFFKTLGRSLTFTIYHFTLSIDLLPARKAILLLSSKENNLFFIFTTNNEKRRSGAPWWHR